MLSLVPHSKIYFAIEPVDFRNGIDGLGGICRNKFNQDPQNGAYFVFQNKRRTTLRILYYDGKGFWLCTKRLSRGKIKWWPKKTGKIYTQIQMEKLQTLIMGGNPDSAEFGTDWKKILK